VVETEGHLPADVFKCVQWGPFNGRWWSVETLWKILRGRPEVVQITALPADPDEIVTPEALRRLPLGEMFKYARTRFHGASYGLRAGIPGHPGDEKAVRQFDEAMLRSHRGIAASADELATVAAVYRKAWENGEPVKRAVALHFHISESTANKRIIRARFEGLLDDVGRDAT
jgi:hypothetical protein